MKDITESTEQSVVRGSSSLDSNRFSDDLYHLETSNNPLAILNEKPSNENKVMQSIITSESVLQTNGAERQGGGQGMSRDACLGNEADKQAAILGRFEELKSWQRLQQEQLMQQQQAQLKQLLEEQQKMQQLIAKTKQNNLCAVNTVVRNGNTLTSNGGSGRNNGSVSTNNTASLANNSAISNENYLVSNGTNMLSNGERPVVFYQPGEGFIMNLESDVIQLKHSKMPPTFQNQSSNSAQPAPCGFSTPPNRQLLSNLAPGDPRPNSVDLRPSSGDLDDLSEVASSDGRSWGSQSDAGVYPFPDSDPEAGEEGELSNSNSSQSSVVMKKNRVGFPIKFTGFSSGNSNGNFSHEVPTCTRAFSQINGVSTVEAPISTVTTTETMAVNTTSTGASVKYPISAISQLLRGHTMSNGTQKYNGITGDKYSKNKPTLNYGMALLDHSNNYENIDESAPQKCVRFGENVVHNLTDINESVVLNSMCEGQVYDNSNSDCETSRDNSDITCLREPDNSVISNGSHPINNMDNVDNVKDFRGDAASLKFNSKFNSLQSHAQNLGDLEKINYNGDNRDTNNSVSNKSLRDKESESNNGQSEMRTNSDEGEISGASEKLAHDEMPVGGREGKVEGVAVGRGGRKTFEELLEEELRKEEQKLKEQGENNINVQTVVKQKKSDPVNLSTNVRQFLRKGTGSARYFDVAPKRSSKEKSDRTGNSRRENLRSENGRSKSYSGLTEKFETTGQEKGNGLRSRSKSQESKPKVKTSLAKDRKMAVAKIIPPSRLQLKPSTGQSTGGSTGGSNGGSTGSVGLKRAPSGNHIEITKLDVMPPLNAALLKPISDQNATSDTVSRQNAMFEKGSKFSEQNATSGHESDSEHSAFDEILPLDHSTPDVKEGLKRKGGEGEGRGGQAEGVDGKGEKGMGGRKGGNSYVGRIKNMPVKDQVEHEDLEEFEFLERYAEDNSSFMSNVSNVNRILAENKMPPRNSTSVTHATHNIKSKISALEDDPTLSEGDIESDDETTVNDVINDHDNTINDDDDDCDSVVENTKALKHKHSDNLNFVADMPTSTGQGMGLEAQGFNNNRLNSDTGLKKIYKEVLAMGITEENKLDTKQKFVNSAKASEILHPGLSAEESTRKIGEFGNTMESFHNTAGSKAVVDITGENGNLMESGRGENGSDANLNIEQQLATLHRQQMLLLLQLRQQQNAEPLTTEQQAELMGVLATDYRQQATGGGQRVVNQQQTMDARQQDVVSQRLSDEIVKGNKSGEWNQQQQQQQWQLQQLKQLGQQQGQQKQQLMADVRQLRADERDNSVEWDKQHQQQLRQQQGQQGQQQQHAVAFSDDEEWDEGSFEVGRKLLEKGHDLKTLGHWNVGQDTQNYLHDGLIENSRFMNINEDEWTNDELARAVNQMNGERSLVEAAEVTLPTSNLVTKMFPRLKSEAKMKSQTSNQNMGQQQQLQQQQQQQKPNIQQITDKQQQQQLPAVTEQNDLGAGDQTKLLKVKVTELEGEIENFRRENAALAKLREEKELGLSQLKKEIEEFERQKTEELKRLEEFKQQEMKKIRKERRLAEQQHEAARALLPDRKEREELEVLRNEITRLTTEATNREQRWSATTTRLRDRIETLEQENEELKRELRLIEKRRLDDVWSDCQSMNGEDGLTRRAHKNSNAMSQSTGALSSTSYNSAPQISNRPLTTVQRHADNRRSLPASGSKLQTGSTAQSRSRRGSVSGSQSGSRPSSEAGSRPGSRAKTPVNTSRDRSKSPRSSLGSGRNTPTLNSGKGQSVTPSPDSIQPIRRSDEISRSSSQPILRADQITRSNSQPIRSCYDADHQSLRLNDSMTSSVTNQSLADEISSTLSPNQIGSQLNDSSYKEVIHSDGKIERLYSTGVQEIIYSNGTRKQISSDGSISTIYFFNGDVKQILPDQRIVYYYSDTQTVHTTFPSGEELTQFPSGQVEKRKSDGSTEIIFPDGTTKYIYPVGKERSPVGIDGNGMGNGELVEGNLREECVYSDGTVVRSDSTGKQRIIEFPNGQREIHADTFKRREYPDGTVKTVYTDGRQETRYSSGRLRVKDSLGNVIIDQMVS